MTPTLEGRIHTRLFLAATVGVLWTVIITPFLPVPRGITAGMSTMNMRYALAFTGLVLMTVYGLVWEHLYHRLQQRRWDKDWPSIFGLLTLLNEAPLVWLMDHLFWPVMFGPTPDMLTVHDGGIAGPLTGMSSEPTPDMYGYLDTSGFSMGLSSPYFPPFAIHVVTTWVIIWLFSQGPMRVLFVRWRFEGGRIVHSGIPDPPLPDGPQPEDDDTAAARVREDVQSRAVAELTPRSRTDGARPNGDLVEGNMCGHGHFGHPALRYCMVCGRPLPQLNGTRTLGRRPPLGLLIFADGTAHVLDDDVRLAEAEGRETVIAGRRDETSAAPALADIRLDGWQPVVSSELYRIVLTLPDGEHVRVAPSASARLTPGAEFTVATHRIRYESPYQPAEPHPGTGESQTEAMPEADAATSLAAATPHAQALRGGGASGSHSAGL